MNTDERRLKNKHLIGVDPRLSAAWNESLSMLNPQ
jgi:hypothetical protein